VAPGLLSPAGDNVIPVCVYFQGGGYPGGLYDSCTPDIRGCAYDAGASPGQRQTGHTVAGVGWHRKHYQLTSEQSDEREVFLCFDDMCVKAGMWLKGFLLGNHLYGYTAFQCDIASFLNPPGQDNVLAVRAKTGVNLRWRSGSDISHHVWLSAVPKTHVALWGLGVSTPVIALDTRSASVNVSLRLESNGTQIDMVT
jgi:beta-galactosidase